MSERDQTEDALRDAAHDAFMAFWRAAECEQAGLWAAYCAAQARYEAYLMRARHRREPLLGGTHIPASASPLIRSPV